MYKNESFKNESFKNIIESFDGIRKDNSRIIFGILLSIITIDIIIDYFILTPTQHQKYLLDLLVVIIFTQQITKTILKL